MADAVVIKIDGDATSFNASLAGIQPTATKAVSGMSGSVLKGMAAWNLLSKGITASVGAIKSVIGVGSTFEASMSEVQSISGATANELQMMEDAARKAGSETAFSASDAAGALKYMALAGWDATQSVDALGGVLNLAGASGMGLQEASDTVTDYMSAFGWAAERSNEFADMMVYANNNANTSASQLGQAFGNSAAYMTSMGQSAQQTTAVLMALANQGTKGAEAGTKISAIWRDISSKMVNGQIAVGKTMVDVVDKSTGEFLDFTQVISGIEGALKGLSEADQAEALQKTFSAARSMPALVQLLNEGSEKIEGYAKGIEGADGIAAKAYETMQDNLQGDIAIFNSALQELELTAYDSFDGIARSATQMGTSMIQAIGEAGKSGGISGMVGELISQVTAKIPELLPSLMNGIQKLVSTISSKLPSMVKGLLSGLPSIFSNIGSLMPNLISSVTAAFGAIIADLVSSLPDYIPQLAEGLWNMVTGAFDAIADGFASFWENLFGSARKIENPEQYNKIDFTAELDYGVEENGESKKNATEEADKKISGFVEELKGYGLKTEDVVKILSFSGSYADIYAQLTENYPNLTGLQKAAIMSKFTNYDLVGELTDYGLSNADIEKILKWKDQGKDAEIVQYLSDNYPDVKELVIKALQHNYENSDYSIDTSGTSMGFGLDLLGDMLTNGIKEDPESIAAIGKIIGEQIESKKTALDEMLKNGHINPDDYDRAMQALELLSGGTLDLTSNYAELTTAECEAAVDGLREMSQTVDEVFANIQAKKDALDSLQGRLFKAGTQGVQLGTEDMVQALQYIGNSQQTELDKWKTAREAEINALDTDAADYADKVEEINQRYETLKEGIMNNSAIDFASLVAGQLAGSGMDISNLQIMYSIKDQINQMISDGELTEENIRSALEAAGYSADTIQAAMVATFGGKTLKEGIDQSGALRELGIDERSITDLIAEGKGLTPEILADNLKKWGYSDETIGQAMAALFEDGIVIPEGMLSIDTLFADLDFSTVGQLIKDAIQNGLIEGPDGWENMNLSDLVMDVLSKGEGNKTEVEIPETEVSGTVKTDVKEDATAPSASEQAKELVKEELEEAKEEGQSTADNNPIDVSAEQSTSVEVTADVDSSSISSEVNQATTQAAASSTQTAYYAGFGIGANMGAGIANGLASTQTFVVNKAKMLAEAAAQAIRDAFKIASPSKLTREMGVFVGQGLGLGMEDEAESVMQSANRMASGALSAVQNQVNALNLRPNLGMDGLSSDINALSESMRGDGSNLYLNVNGRTLAQVTAEDNNSALNAFSNRIALGYGRG